MKKPEIKPLLPLIIIMIIFISVSWTGRQVIKSGDAISDQPGIIAVFQDSSSPVENRIRDLMPKLTLEEKAGLVAGTGMRGFGAAPANGQSTLKVPGAAGTTMPVTRLGIPSIILADGPAGLRINPFRGT